MKQIQTRTGLNASVRIPGSKSITHRALIAAALAEGDSLLENHLVSEDTLHTRKVLEELGAKISVEGKDLKVAGTGGVFPGSSRERTFNLGNSGTSLRLLLSVIALAPGHFTVTGSERMLERPIGPLVNALSRLGSNVSFAGREGYPPVAINGGGVRGGKVVMKGDQSSQYISSILMAAPCFSTDTEIEIAGDPVSKPYIDITIDVMEQYGVRVKRNGYAGFMIPSGRKYRPTRFVIQGDASSASYFWAAAAVTGGSVVTENIQAERTRQGDMGLLHLFEEMGCKVERRENSVVVAGGELKGIETDMSAMPDMVPTLAAVALFAKGKTVIRNVAHLRHKESDRLRAVRMECGRMGGNVEETEDGLIIEGGGKLSGAVIDPHDDHRIAMSMAVVGLKVPGVVIENSRVRRQVLSHLLGIVEQTYMKLHLVICF